MARPVDRFAGMFGIRRAGPCACSAVAIVLLIFGAVAEAHAQCALRVTPRPGETGYRKRAYGCEGLYVQPQSATLNVQVISLIRGTLDLRSHDAVRIRVPELSGLRERVAIAGRGRTANLNWALDGFAKPDSAMEWDLNSVVHATSMDVAHLGVYGETRRANGLGGPVYVPVDISSAARPGEDAVPIELVIRIPAAGAAMWRLSGAQEYKRAAPIDGDGFFVFELPAGRGEKDFEIRWSPRGKRDFGAPESIRIVFW